MAMMTKTTGAARIPEVWANKTLGHLAGYLNLVKTVNRDYEKGEIAQYGDTVNITKRGALQANDKTETGDVQLQSPSESKIPVVLNNWKEVSFSPSDVLRAESKPKQLEEYTQDAAMVIAEAVESALAAEYANAGDDLDISGAATTNVDIATLRKARRMLISNKVPKTADIFGYISEYDMELIDITDASKMGTQQGVVEGALAKLGGVNLFESQGIPESGSAPVKLHNLVYSRDAMALVVRPLPTDAESFGGAKQTVVYDEQTGLAIRVTMSYNANKLAPQVTLDVLFAVKTVRPEFLINLATAKPA